MQTPDIQSSFEFDPNYNFNTTLATTKSPVLVGPSVWWCTRTPEGTASAIICKTQNSKIELKCWGKGSAWIEQQLPLLLGLKDSPETFNPSNEKLARAWKVDKFKLGRTDLVWDALVGAIFSQKVQATKAAGSIQALAKRFGEPCPGPRNSMILPSADTVASMSYTHFHNLGVERKRAQTLIRAARQIGALNAAKNQGAQELIMRLESIEGIGPWTSNLVAVAVLGYSDAVPIGDFHIPNYIAWFFRNQARSTDIEMLELLKPYAGNRWRVINLAKRVATPPKFGPRLSLKGFGIDQAL